jgi:hypothetical protein
MTNCTSATVCIPGMFRDLLIPWSRVLEKLAGSQRVNFLHFMETEVS